MRIDNERSLAQTGPSGSIPRKYENIDDMQYQHHLYMTGKNNGYVVETFGKTWKSSLKQKNTVQGRHGALSR